MGGLPHPGGRAEAADPPGLQGLLGVTRHPDHLTLTRAATIDTLAKEAVRQDLMGVMVWFCRYYDP